MSTPVPGENPIQVELSAHKTLAALVTTLVTVAGYLVSAGLLHGEALRWTQGGIGVAALLGITGVVYAIPNKVLAVKGLPPALPDDDGDNLDDLDTSLDALSPDGDAWSGEYVDPDTFGEHSRERLAGRPSPVPLPPPPAKVV